MLWLNFIHLYQPINLDPYYIKEAADKSYRRLVDFLEQNPRFKFTANITGGLLIRLEDSGYGDLIKRLKRLTTRGQLELVGSAAYHAFLPLLPEEEVIYQIKEQEKILHHYFGDLKLQGFFIPEMSYSPKLAKVIKGLGYQWLILDEISCGGKLQTNFDFSGKYIDDQSGLKIVFRNRKLSNSYVPRSILDLLSQLSDDLVITATDAELYGLRHEDPSAELEALAKEKNLKTLTISDFLKSQSKLIGKKVHLVPSTWESLSSELKRQRPFWLWSSNKNPIQNYSWQLANLAMSLGREFKDDKNYYYYRWHLDRGLASCTFWWASGHSFSHNFGPLAWSPDEVERGLNDLIRSVRSLLSPKSLRAKLKAEKFYIKAKEALWRSHWERYWHPEI